MHQLSSHATGLAGRQPPAPAPDSSPAAADTPARVPLPAIPGSRVETVTEPDGILLWLRHGSMRVRVAGTDVHARPGQAVWLPPRTEHSVDLAAGSVAVPLVVEEVETDDLPERVSVVAVPREWSEWLLHRLSRWFGLGSGTECSGQHLRELVTSAAAPRRRPSPTYGTAVPELPRLPRLPRSAPARRVVERLLREPADTAGLAELAAGVHTSRRTLQRQLDHETGLSLSQWRVAVRMSAAATYLAGGRGLGWTAHQVGYAGPSGLINAFSAWCGLTPGQYAALCAGRATEPRTSAAVVDTVLDPQAALRAAPEVPPSGPASWVPDFDSCLWVYCGSAVLTVAGQEHDLARGDIVWLDRGVSCHLRSPAGSIILPIGLVAGGPARQARAPRVRSMPVDEQTELFLLHLVVANHFLLRPPAHDEDASLDPLRPTRPTGNLLPPGPAEVVAAVLADPTDRQTLSGWARSLGVDPLALSRDFALHVGEPFVRWRATVRMSEARILLWSGHAPSVVARRLGYTHLSAFSKAFSSAHGIPPSEWLRREAG